MTISSVAESFDSYFYATYAHTEQMRKLMYRLRYQVYCLEFRYEPADKFPEQMEWDLYDAHSLHCLLMHKPSGNAAGCVRLIMPREGESDAMLPFERCCSKALDKSLFDLNTLSRDRFGEISRLAVPAAFRRRKSDENKPISVPDRKTLIAEGRSPFPLIAISLCLAIGLMLLHSGLEYGFAMMEPRLIRMLRRYGIGFKQIGDVVDYHGNRGPFLLTRSGMLSDKPKLPPDVGELLQVVDRQLLSSKPVK